MDHAARDELARALRELKARKAYTFEELSARTGISRSALHRYCSGSSVPGEFAPVERIARECGAGRPELLALHALWAHVTEPAPEAPAAVPAPEPVSTPTPTAPPRRRVWVTVCALLMLSIGAASAPSLVGSTGKPPLSAACRTPVGLGQQGGCVREVQRLLLAAGADVEEDGRYTADTRRRVLAFQALASLPPHGVVDDATKQALHQGGISLASWDAARVADRIRAVFAADPERAVRLAECRSLLDPLYVMSDTGADRTWGVFQLSESHIHELGGTIADSLDSEWNIQAAHRLWGSTGHPRAWPDCLLSVN